MIRPADAIHCDEESPESPIALALARARGLPGQPGRHAWAALDTGTVGTPCAWLPRWCSSTSASVDLPAPGAPTRPSSVRCPRLASALARSRWLAATVGRAVTGAEVVAVMRRFRCGVV